MTGTFSGELKLHWKVVLSAALGSGAGITGMSVYSLSILMNPLTDAFGWSRGQVSATKTILTSGFVLSGPVIGFVADRYGVRRIALCSLGLLSLAMLWMTQLAGSITGYYLSLFVLSLAGCGTTHLVWTRAVATWFEHSRGLALGLTLTGTGLAGILTPPLLEFMIRSFDWRAAYITMASAAALALIPVGCFFRENRGRSIAAARSPPGGSSSVAVHAGLTVSQAIGSRHFWQLFLGFTLIGAVVSALMIHLVPLLTDGGIARGLAVRIASAMGFAVVLGRVTTGYLIDKLHAPFVAGTFLIMPALGCVFLSAAALSPLTVLMAALLIGLAAGSEVDLIPYLTARYFGLRAYGRIYGWIVVGFFGGAGVGPLFLGRMYDADGDYQRALAIAIPTLVLGAATVATLGRAPKFSG